MEYLRYRQYTVEYWKTHQSDDTFKEPPLIFVFRQLYTSIGLSSCSKQVRRRLVRS
jgi:hypothetical protein